MSVKYLPSNRLRLECDGPQCSNHYELANDQSAMATGNEWLQRRGWRTIVFAGRQEHFCAYCAAKDSRFHNGQRAPRKIGSQAGTEHVHARR